MICAILVLAIGTVGVAPITAGAVYSEPVNPSLIEDTANAERVGKILRVVAEVIDWLIRLHWLFEEWQNLQPRVTFIHGRSGIAHWALSGEHAADIVNGIVNWR